MSLAQAKDNKNGYVPHKMLFNIVQLSAASQPWIKRDVINAFFKNTPSYSHADTALILTAMRNSNNNIRPSTDDSVDDCTDATTYTINNEQDATANENRTKGVRPKKSKNLKRKYMEVAVTAFLNEITAKYAEEKIACGNGRI